MSARLQCDSCGEWDLNVVPGLKYDMPSDWIAVRMSYREEQHYCSTRCLLDSHVLPDVIVHTTDQAPTYELRLPPVAQAVV